MMIGNHLIVDIYNVPEKNLVQMESFKVVLTRAVLQAGAKILNTYFHSFGDEFGFTGVICLSESHVSIHTWPEHNYAAIDIFMCGQADAEKVLEYLKEVMPKECRFEVNRLIRG